MPAQAYKSVPFNFINKGFVSKLDVSQLQPGQYQTLTNLNSLQEATLVTRNGSEKIALSGTGALSYMHTLGRVATGIDPTKNYRYIGEGQDIYRTTSQTSAAIGSPVVPGGLGINFFGQRWNMQSYRKFSSGTPYGYFATAARNLIDPLDDTATGTLGNLLPWGINRPVIPAYATLGAPIGSGIGPNGTYQYVYTFLDPRTGSESNPSMVQPPGAVVDTGGAYNAISVNLYNTGPAYVTNVADPFYVDPRINNQKSVLVVYRSGGAYFDGLYRRVGYADSPNGSNLVVFTDTISDDAIASAPIALFDNDTPVTSTLKVPFSGHTTTPLLSGTTNSFTLTLDRGLYPGVTKIADILSPGTTLQIQDADKTESVVLWHIDGDFDITIFCQFPHDAGVVISTGSTANKPCELIAQAFNSLFLAGDQNNPNYLYKSKTGRPEAWPVVNLEDASPGSVEVGTPEDYIVAITEFNGDIVCLNKESIYVERMWGTNGSMTTPIRTQAERGLFGKRAWVKGDNALYYLSYDGIYMWSGGASVKISEAIDPMFRGEYVNGFVPFSFSTSNKVSGVSYLDSIQFFYYKNELIIFYYDAGGGAHTLRYHTLYQRWWLDEESGRIRTAGMFEGDTGLFLYASTDNAGTPGAVELLIADTPVTDAIPSSSDGWTNSTHNDGQAIAWIVKTAFFNDGLPSMNKHWGDLVLELKNNYQNVTVKVYYDYSATADTVDVFTIAPAGGRRRISLPLQSAHAKEAYAMAVEISGSGTEPVTLYNLVLHYLPLEEIQRGRAYDWDDLGWPYDKKLTQVTIEYDTFGWNVTCHMDIIYGIDGANLVLAKQDFTLTSTPPNYNPATPVTGPLRAKQTFPINDATICKLVRLRPEESATDFKIIRYDFKFEQYPPDTSLFTEWTADGYPCEKILRELIVEVNTGDVDAKVAVQVDGTDQEYLVPTQEVVHTTDSDRNRILTFNSDVIGRMFRTVNTPGTGGKYQLFNLKYNWIPEPCAVVHWDSYEQAFGWNGWKFMKQCWFEYLCRVALILRIYTDDFQLFHETTLPPHDHRDVERLYVPNISDKKIFNKSKIYRFTLDSCDQCSPFKLYRDSTRAEIMFLTGDMRQAYVQNQLFEPIPIPSF